MTLPDDSNETLEQRRNAHVPSDFVRLSELLLYVGQVLERGFGGYVWVSAEIGTLTDRKHLFMELLELDDSGREQARTRATLFAPERFKVEGRFRRVTGAALEPGLSVLLGVVPTFHPQYGFSLNVLDIAPAFTLGAAQQKLEAARAQLEAEGLFSLNRQQPIPQDFSRVAVLSPEKAAGLEDFQQTVAALEREGVCQFTYFRATFQGHSAAGSLQSALEAVRRAHAERPFDALCILRGGGSSLDLAWLSDLELARAVARMPLPVLTGIGHARDDTLLDELAALRLDTPSKLAAFVLSRIAGGAARAEDHFLRIRQGAQHILNRHEHALERLYGHAYRAARRSLERRETDVEHLMRRILGLHPTETLRRGYTVVRSGGRVLTTAAEARGHPTLQVQFQDDTLEVHS